MGNQHDDFKEKFQKAFFQHLNSNYRAHSYYVAMTARAMLHDLAEHAFIQAISEPDTNDQLKLEIFSRANTFMDVLAWMSEMIELKECLDIRERA